MVEICRFQPLAQLISVISHPLRICIVPCLVQLCRKSPSQQAATAMTLKTCCLQNVSTSCAYVFEWMRTAHSKPNASVHIHRKTLYIMLVYMCQWIISFRELCCLTSSSLFTGNYIVWYHAISNDPSCLCQYSWKTYIWITMSVWRVLGMTTLIITINLMKPLWSKEIKPETKRCFRYFPPYTIRKIYGENMKPFTET